METKILTIVTETEDGRSEFLSEATVTQKGGEVRIGYSVDGDEAFLTWDGEVLRMERRGRLHLSAEFAVGLPAEMQVRSAEGSFCIPLETVRLSAEVRQANLFLTLFYRLIFNTSSKDFHLKISV